LGLSAVPQPFHSAAAAVAGLECVTLDTTPFELSEVTPITVVVCDIISLLCSSPNSLSIALLISCDLGNPDPYTHAAVSLTSHPASSTPQANLCHILVPPNAAQ